MPDTHAPYAQWAESVIATAPLAASVSVSPSSVDTYSGESVQLTASALGTDGLPAAAAFTWSSTNPSVAVASSSGRITAGAAGVAVVRATAPGGAYDEATINVGFHVVSAGIATPVIALYAATGALTAVPDGVYVVSGGAGVQIK